MSQKSAENRKAKMLAILDQLETKGNMKNSGIETLKTAVVGLAGAGAGVVIGKPSLLLGMGTTMVGHYMKSPRTVSFGVGMMASGGSQLAMNGTSSNKKELVKDRLKSFSSNLKERLYLDKIFKPKKKEEGTSGLGSIQHFKFPHNELDMGALNTIEEEIRKSSELLSERQVAGAYDEDVSGVEDRIY